jgi:predicted phage tail protein
MLAWLPPASGSIPTSYILEAGMASGASDAAVLATGNAATSYMAVGVAVGTYYVRIRAVTASGISAASNEVIVTVGAGGPTGTAVPAAPFGLRTGGSAVSATASMVTLAWSRSPAGAPPTFYVIEAGSAPGRTDLANFSTGNALTSFTASGVPAGTYFVRVRAGNALGLSAPSNEVVLIVGAGAALPCDAAPGAPAGLQSVVTGSTVSLFWGAAAGGPASYVIEAGSFPGGSDLAISDTDSTATEFRAGGVAPGTYFIRVRGRNACGAGGASNEVTVVVR